MASMNDLIEGKVQTEFKEGPKSMNDLIEEVKPTPPIQVNLDTIVKTPDPIAKDIYKFMPHLGTDPITQGMMSQPEGGWNEFGVPIEKGKRILPEIDKPDTLSIDTGKPSLIEQAINKVAGIFGEEYHRKLSPTAKAQATVQLMAKEAGVPLSLYRQSPEFLEQAAHSFVNMASLGLVPAFRESLTGEISFPATSTSGYIGGALGSLAGLFTTPTLMTGKVLAPVISNLPKVTAEAPIVYRMLTESLRDAAILGPAMGLAQAGEALKSTTFSDAATNIWHGVKSGAITGALFGTTRGLLPGSDLAQTATRIAAGLVGLNAQRALEVGGNPFTNRPVGEVIFDTLLDVAFLAKGMPKGEFAKLGNDIDNIVKKKADIEQKQEIVNNMLDEDLKRAQEEIIKVEKVQADLELAELTKKITYDQMIKEDLSSKGRKIEQIKQPKKAIADEVINKAMEKLPEEEVKKTMMSEIEPKEDVTFIGMQEGLNGESFPLVNDKNKSTITYDPEKHNIVNKEEFIKEIHGIEMEPITDLDLQTGTMEPLELSTEKSPFRDTPEHTQQMKAMYETNADKVGRDVEMTTSKLINDVNRYLDGEEVPISEIRNQLSEFASRADELRDLFGNRTNFDSWKATVSEAAKWARGADRLKNEQTVGSESSVYPPTKQGISKSDEVMQRSAINKIDKVSEGKLSIGREQVLTIMKKDILNQRPIETITNELIQNSLDAYEGTNKERIIYLNTDTLYRNDPNVPEPVKDIMRSNDVTIIRVIRFKDEGLGMSNKEVADQYLKVGNEGVKTEMSRGGYGFAKVSYLLFPDYFELITSNGKELTHFAASSEDFMKGNKFDIKTDPLPKGEDTGTEVVMYFANPDVYINDFNYAAKSYSKSLRVGTTINVNGESFKTKDWKDVESIIPTKKMSIDGSDFEIKFVPQEPYGYSYGSGYNVKKVILNKGLALPSLTISSPPLRYRPDFSIEMNFLKTPLTKDENYPFLKNRTEILSKIQDDVNKFVEDKIKEMNAAHLNRQVNNLKELIDNAQTVGGIKIINPFINSRDVVNEQLRSHPEVFEHLSSIFSMFNNAVNSIGREGIEICVTLDPNVHGYRPNKDLGLPNIIAYNPFAITKDLLSTKAFEEAIKMGANVDSVKASCLINTLYHEYAHVKESGHGESFSHELETLGMLIDYETNYLLKEEANGFFKKHSSYINAIGEDLQSLKSSEPTLQNVSQSQVGKQRLSESGRGEVANGHDRDSGEDRSTGGIEKKTPSTFTMYSGLPVDKLYEGLLDLAKKGARGTRKAKEMKEFNIKEATKLLKRSLTTSFSERSGNTRRELSKTDAGYYAMSNMYMARGGHPKALQVFGQMRKEVDSGLSRAEIDIKDSLIKFLRVLDIAKYKTAKQFSFPEDSTPEIAAAYVSLFKYKKANEIRDLTPDEAYRLYHVNEDGSIGGRVGAYFDTMKRAVKDLYEEGMVTKEEYDNLIKHNYRKIRLVDIFDDSHLVKLGGKKITVHDSGIERLAKGKKTDIYEADSNIVALETLNTIYSRIYKNRANKELYELALNDKENPFARIKESKGDKIPEDFRNHYVKVYIDGVKKTVFLSNKIGPEWVTSNAQTTYKYAQFLRYASASPLVKTFATGINQAFALRNLPRDALQAWFTARIIRPEPSKVFGRFESVYSPTIPVAMYQMGKHYARVLTDAALKKGSYNDYIDDGGGMELLTPQGRLLFHGKHIERPLEAFYNFAGYLGTTSELLSRLAIRDMAINRRANEKGKTFKEESKDKKSRKEATFAARDYMDFSQGGDIIKAMDNAIPYLNPKIVAMRGFLRAWKDQPVVSAYKLAQFSALATGLYIGNQLIHPQTMKELEGDRRTIGNLVFPLGDIFGFKDEMGENRYPFIVIPINQEMAFFKALSEAGIDWATGKEVNVDRIVQSFKSISPADITSLPPTVSGALGYTMNKDFWMGKDIVSRDKGPFEYSLPKWLAGGKGTSENERDKNTSQAAIDLGAATGLSPKRLEYLMGQLITNDNMYAQILGKAYKEAFGQLPQKHRDFILTEAISKVPIIKAFFKLTNPYSKYADSIQEAKDKATIDRAIENNFLDIQVDAYLHGGKVDRSEIESYMRSFKDKKTYDRLKDRFEFQEKIDKVPNRNFWLGIKSITDVNARAREYVKWAEKDPENIIAGYNYIKSRGGLGIITDEFRKEVEKFKSVPKP